MPGLRNTTDAAWATPQNAGPSNHMHVNKTFNMVIQALNIGRHDTGNQTVIRGSVNVLYWWLTQNTAVPTTRMIRNRMAQASTVLSMIARMTNVGMLKIVPISRFGSLHILKHHFCA